MKTAKEISSEWPEYDKMIALSQWTNYGVIYLDEYNLPIDDEYLLEELVKGEKNELRTERRNKSIFKCDRWIL